MKEPKPGDMSVKTSFIGQWYFEDVNVAKNFSGQEFLEVRGV